VRSLEKAPRFAEPSEELLRQVLRQLGVLNEDEKKLLNWSIVPLREVFSRAGSFITLLAGPCEQRPGRLREPLTQPHHDHLLWTPLVQTASGRFRANASGRGRLRSILMHPIFLEIPRS
jgi:hypothetical protein